MNMLIYQEDRKIRNIYALNTIYIKKKLTEWKIGNAVIVKRFNASLSMLIKTAN